MKEGDKVKLIRVVSDRHAEPKLYSMYHNKIGKLCRIEKANGLRTDQPYLIQFDNGTTLWCSQIEPPFEITLPEDLFD